MTTMLRISAFLLFASLGVSYVEEATALSGNATVVVYNSTIKKIYARVVDASTSSGSRHYAVPPNGIRYISFEQSKRCFLFFASDCSEEKGHLKNCLSGNCPDSGCNITVPPSAATVIRYDSGSLTIATSCGYNFGIRGDFQCSRCDCSSISCIIPLSKCPSKTKLLVSGVAVACEAGNVPSCQDDTSAPSFYSPPTGSSCFDGAVLKITVSSPPKD